MTAGAAAAPADAADASRLVPGGLSWPAVRGARLLRLLTPLDGDASESEGEGEGGARLSDASTRSASASALGFELDMCVPAPGHVALVLTRRAPDAAAPAPHVVFVMDAVPPKTAARSQPSDAGATAPPETRRATSAPVPTKGGRLSLTPVPVSQYDVDEVELIEELLAAPRASGSDGAVLAKAPLLCARFDCRVVGVRFIGAEAAKPSATGVSAPLRCVVAREDGMAFLWEWRADLHQWTFMNRFCFLENPNLSWTKPVVAFTATQTDAQPVRLAAGARGPPLPHLRSSGGAYGVSDGEEEVGGPMELSWWSTEVKHEPKLWQRSVRFVRETNTFRTDVVVGSAHAILPPSCTDVATLLPSKVGLWAISASAGIFFRSASLLSTLSMSWETATTAQDTTPTGNGNRDESPSHTIEAVVVCSHNVTGELLVVQRATGAVFLVSAPQSLSSPQLRAKKLTTLTPWQDGDHVVKEIVGHRHLLLVRKQRSDDSVALHIHSLVTGKVLEVVPLPCVSPTMPPALLSSPKAAETSGLTAALRLWVLTGKASAVGLWSPSSFWSLHLPSAKQVAAAHRAAQQDPAAAFATVKDYGESSRLDAALFALDSLEQAITFVASATAGSDQEGVSYRVDDRDPKWRAAVASMSNPALLLALMTSGSRRMPKALINELAALVGAIHDASQELAVGSRGAIGHKNTLRAGGRNVLSAGGDAGIDNEVVAAAGRRLMTPANLESLEHLANWIVLAKRKLASLQSAAFGNGNATTGSVTQRARVRAPVESGGDDQDATNFRLSRKLRPMSNLRFAAQSCALGEHGKQWLTQLEAFLLAGVPFKSGQDSGRDSASNVAMPSHLLFHEERVLDDYARHGGAPSFSKHMYLESMARLYLQHEPEALLAFVECVERFCPRLFTLAGRANVAKSHAERALALLPPVSLLVERVRKSAGTEPEAETARASLEAYVRLLCHCAQWAEASRALLECDLYERCKSLVLQPLVDQVGEAAESKGAGVDSADSASQSEGEKVKADRQAAAASVYLALVEHCVRRRYPADELAALVKRKPPHVATLTLLRALRGWLAAGAEQEDEREGEAARVTVGKLRSVLSVLLATTAKASTR